MRTIPTDTSQPTTRVPIEDSLPDQLVSFGGDGEPKSARSMLQTLVEFEEEIGLDSDSYSLGGNVQQIEEKMAELLGKEAAVFMPTGTLANHLAVRILCGDKPRAVVQEQSHLYQDSGDCVSRLSNINLLPLAKDRPHFTIEELKRAVENSELGRVLTPVGALMIESPVRRQEGKVVPFDEMRAITNYCRERGIGTHLDGARLYMMSGATGVSVKTYASLFDTVYVSLYKYFGAPFGSVLASTSQFCDGLYHDRRMFGGGLASANFAAALALKGVEGFEERYHTAMKRATTLFDKLNTLAGIHVGRIENGSNIFPMDLSRDLDLDKFVKILQERSVSVSVGDPDIRRSTLRVNTTILRQDVDTLFAAFCSALEGSRL
ncbi:DegT/DnrJ/EryC1/StrS family aminotransferase [Candidatus Poribacteria bacterium]|nr:DegT/DnrJ/EryC1/StrS family aminotransferase [Candidatus Poribacteria bacterium]